MAHSELGRVAFDEPGLRALFDAPRPRPEPVPLATPEPPPPPPGHFGGEGARPRPTRVFDSGRREGDVARWEGDVARFPSFPCALATATAAQACIEAELFPPPL
mmetsp:Transcript_73490/g.138867  ORF Transcript_73490/g.138867 Transcript_73490/m.138867 type:complete len:104 (+) Transcript_73490:65-376(+)